ncbi:phage minor tail protein L [Leclercia adecarboxylata]|uniref:phage minor tail protein L n=1 Tax=Leclercia adecarboxylata TaxID=83655 RepID=UPI001904507E|nr:phage minor tail protein L [Leclercia adecarboxylata]MBK0350262.1 phage minor tail protein L [Leclercia adecarboxylata]MCZ7841513.1 phage minor tail protein L [Leclercia adecarboxylata]
MSLNSDYQKLEPGNQVRLFSVDGTAFGTGEVLRFHSYNVPHTEAEIVTAGGDESKLPAKSIWWQGQEYKAWPCQIDGVEASTSGSSAQPKLSVANLDGSVTALCLAYDDLLQAKVTIHDTLAQYLDARNFAGGNPAADATQEKLQVWYIDAKTSETNEVVEFALSSPMDLQGLMIPTRQLHSLCTWCIRNKYRTGDGCDYAGTRYFDKNNKPVSDPSLDECNGTLSACKLRFGENNELSFGGFPGTSLIRS